MMVDERPDWWMEGESKLYRGDFPLVARYNPGFWDVHYGGSMNTVLIPSGPRFNQLLEYNPVSPSEIIGDVALNWESYQDGEEFGYIFHLNPNVTFTDGHPLTAEDVVFSLNRITLGQLEEGVLRARTGMLNNFPVYNTFEAVDDYTVKVVTVQTWRGELAEGWSGIAGAGGGGYVIYLGWMRKSTSALRTGMC